MEKKSAFITGTAGNLGSAVSQHLLDIGYHVIGGMRPQEHHADLEAQPHFERIELNVLDEAACEAFVASRGEEIHLVALLVGGFAMGGVTETTGDHLTNMFRLNILSAFFLAREFLKKMATQPNGGRIILVGAKPALTPAQGTFATAYTLTKSMIYPLADMLNAEGQADKVVTSVIVPSIIDTPRNRSAMPDADFSKWVKPLEIAKVMAFLASEQGHIIREPIVKVYGES